MEIVDQQENALAFASQLVDDFRKIVRRFVVKSAFVPQRVEKTVPAFPIAFQGNQNNRGIFGFGVFDVLKQARLADARITVNIQGIGEEFLFAAKATFVLMFFPKRVRRVTRRRKKQSDGGYLRLRIEERDIRK